MTGSQRPRGRHHYCYRDLLASPPEGLRIIAPDLPGYGWSGPAPHRWGTGSRAFRACDAGRAERDLIRGVVVHAGVSSCRYGEMALTWHAGQVVRPVAGDVAPSAWIRNRRRTRTWAALTGVWSVLLAGLLLRSGARADHPGLGGALALGALVAGIVALGIVSARRVATAGVWIGPEGIVVRGPFKRLAVAFEDAGLFVVGLQGRGGNGTPCPLLERQGRKPVGVWALGQRNIWFRYDRVCEEIQPLCDELNALVEAVRSGPRRA